MSFEPLKGMQVIDLTTSFAGPYCSQLLSLLGADVLKIERLQGDDSRQWGPPFFGEDPAIFLAANAGKRSLAIDLRRGTDIVARLAGKADVFVQSMRPGLADELGLSAHELRARNQRLVYCAIGSYGNAGPKQHKPGYDPLMQAAGGIISVTGWPDKPIRLGISAIDQATGMWAALAVLAAIVERERHGNGQVVDVALYETAISFMAYHLIGYLGSGIIPRPAGTAFGSVAPYQMFATSDGDIMVAAANDRMYHALCDLLDLSELKTDPRFVTNSDRVAHRSELADLIAPRFETADRATWLARLDEARIPSEAVSDVGDVAASEQTKALGILQELDGVTLVGPPFSFDQKRPEFRNRPPAVGADTMDILTEAGYSAAEVAEFIDSGIVGIPANKD